MALGILYVIYNAFFLKKYLTKNIFNFDRGQLKNLSKGVTLLPPKIARRQKIQKYSEAEILEEIVDESFEVARFIQEFKMNSLILNGIFKSHHRRLLSFILIEIQKEKIMM